MKWKQHEDPEVWEGKCMIKSNNFSLVRRKIKRKKPGTGPSKTYFTQETQKSIVKYQLEENRPIKEIIYVKEILPAFDSLVENLINVYGFKVQLDSKEDLKHECMEFLYGTVHKYDASKNSKAFSYFNVVAKHWLTIKSKQNAKKMQQYISIDDLESMSIADAEKIEGHNYIASYDETVSAAELKTYIDKVLTELESRAKSTNEKATLAAVKDIMTNIESLEFFSKRALLLYIREITKLNSKQLSMCLSSLKKQYKELKKSEEYNY